MGGVGVLLWFICWLGLRLDLWYLRIDCIGWLLLLGLECGCNCCGACVVGLLVSVADCELVGW